MTSLTDDNHVRDRRIRERCRPGGRSRDRGADDGHAGASRARTATGYYCEGPVALGHRRLSIIDVGGGAQPMCNEDGSIWVSYNGELYNELRAAGGARGERPSLSHRLRHREPGPSLRGRGRRFRPAAQRHVRAGDLGPQARKAGAGAGSNGPEAALLRGVAWRRPGVRFRAQGGAVASGDRPRDSTVAAWLATSFTNMCPHRIRSGSRSASCPAAMC